MHISPNFNDHFLKEQADPNDLSAALLRQGSLLKQIGQGFVRVDSLEEIAQEIGNLDYRAVDSDGKLRMIMSAIDLFEQYGIHAHLAGFDENGKPTFWLSADDGSGVAGGGVVTFGLDGLGVMEVGAAVELQQDSSDFGRKLFIYIDIGGVAHIVSYQQNGSELVTNGDFESGDLTGWSTLSGSPAIQSDITRDGAYALHLSADGEIESSSYITVTAEQFYVPSVWSYYGFQGSNARLFIDWYTSGNVLIDTSQLNLNQTSTFTRSLRGFKAPPTAAKAKIRIDFVLSMTPDDLYVDEVSLVQALSYGELNIGESGIKLFSFRTDGGLALYDGYWNELFDAETSGSLLYYRQFVYEVYGGDFSFVIDEDGQPVMALESLEAMP